MQVGDLVRIKRGETKGRLALVVKVGKRTPIVFHCIHPWNIKQDEFGYYKQDLEVLCKQDHW